MTLGRDARNFIAGAGVVAALGGLFFAGYVKSNVSSQRTETQRSGVTYQRDVPNHEALHGLYERFVADYNDPVVRYGANELSSLIESGSSGRDIKDYVELFSRRYGSSKTLGALFIASRPPNVPMPTDVEYEQYANAYLDETGVNVSGLTPDQLEQMLFSHEMDAMFYDPSNQAGLAMILIKSSKLGPSDHDRHVDRWNKAQGYSGNIQGFINKAGRQPNQQELYDMSWKGAAYSVTEDQLRTTQSPDTSIYRSWESPSGSGGSRSFDPTDVPGDHRLLNSQPYVDERQQRQENMQRAAEDINRFGQAVQQKGQEAAGQIKGALENLFKPPPKKPPQN